METYQEERIRAPPPEEENEKVIQLKELRVSIRIGMFSKNILKRGDEGKKFPESPSPRNIYKTF